MSTVITRYQDLILSLKGVIQFCANAFIPWNLYNLKRWKTAEAATNLLKNNTEVTKYLELLDTDPPAGLLSLVEIIYDNYGRLLESGYTNLTRAYRNLNTAITDAR